MLSGDEIRELIAKGTLEIEPLVEAYQIGVCSIDLRIGTSVMSGPPVAAIQSLEIGQPVEIDPGHHLHFATLESLGIPVDIAGIVMLRSTFSRIGLVMLPSAIDPGWRGKLALGLFNWGMQPIKLHAGQRVASIRLFKLNATPDITRKAAPFGPILDHLIDTGSIVPTASCDKDTDTFSREFRAGEFAHLAKASREIIERVKSPESTNTETLASSLEAALSEEDSQQKGKLLEDFAEHLIKHIQGLSVIKRNARLKAEEIDVIVRNGVDSTFGRSLGNPIIVECKNWSGKVGVPELDHLAAKMTSLSPDVKLGVLIAVNGISGNSRRDAELRRREYRQRGQYIVVLERQDLEQVASGGKSPWEVIENKYSDLYLI